MDNITYVIGQILGIGAVIGGFFSYQMKTPAKLILWQIVIGIFFVAHYFFIGAGMTAVILNLIATIQSVAFYFRDKREKKGFILPAIFVLVMIISSIITWENWYTVFIMVGLCVNVLSLALTDTQKTRYFMFIKSPLCLIYNIIVLSGGGIIYEVTVLVSSIIGTIKNFKEKRKEKCI